MYVVTNGTYFMKINDDGKMKETEDVSQACKFKKRCDKLAEGLSRSTKYAGQWRCIYYSENSNNEIKDMLLLKEQIEKTLVQDNIDDISINTLYGLINLISDGIDLKLDDLRKKLSIKDQEISDILHAMEFYRLNACEGYKLYKLMREKRLERREIKNEIEEINELFNYTVRKISKTRYEEGVGKLKEKQYTPRIMSELFEDRK